jgi:NAD+ diphosphatase
MVDEVPHELGPVSLRTLAPTIAADEASLAVHGVGLARWHQTHTHCSRCGALTEPAQAGHTRVCVACGTEHFPRTDPAVIMLITDGDDRALLGRNRAWGADRFSTLAGFVEPGETLDDAVRREVKEEVGISVGEVRYAGSQPWPFPSSLMLGFFGTALPGDITVDANEISEARWFSRQEISDLTASSELWLPSTLSISRWLIDTWHGGEISGTWS